MAVDDTTKQALVRHCFMLSAEEGERIQAAARDDEIIRSGMLDYPFGSTAELLPVWLGDTGADLDLVLIDGAHAFPCP